MKDIHRLTVSWRVEALFLLSVLAVFLLLTLSHFRSPGFILDNLMDEQRSAAWAEQWRAGQPLQFSNGFGASPFYHGHMTSHLMLPFFMFFGNSWILVRSWPVVFGAFTLLVSYLFARRVFDVKVAILGTFMLVLHPSFIFGVRAGNFHVSSMLLFSIGSLWMIWMWRDTHRLTCLFFSGMLLGMGIATRLWFVLFASAAILSCLWLPLAAGVRMEYSDRLKAVGAFAAGLMPFLLWMCYTEIIFPTVVHLGYTIKLGSRHTLWNLDYERAFPRWNMLLDGGFFHRLYFFNFKVYAIRIRSFIRPPFWVSDSPFVWVFWWSVLMGVIRGYVGRETNRKLRWIAMFFIVYFIVTAYYPKIVPHHVFLVYPLPQILIAAVFWDLLSTQGLGKKFALALVVLLGCVVVDDSIRLGRHYLKMKAVGCSGMLTDSSYDLYSFMRGLERNPRGKLLCVTDDLVYDNLFFHVPDIMNLPLENLETVTRARVMNRHVYVVVEYLREGRLALGEAFAIIARNKKKMRLMKTIHENNGVVTFEIYEVV
ncbi:MAG TPA: glycosyltransferase family 39 protein [Elusimicrobiota bacterium]|nr:glycosyltransferase family 39 protein [Elusimicrobiota bacterium]